MLLCGWDFSDVVILFIRRVLSWMKVSQYGFNLSWFSLTWFLWTTPAVLRLNTDVDGLYAFINGRWAIDWTSTHFRPLIGKLNIKMFERPNICCNFSKLGVSGSTGWDLKKVHVDQCASWFLIHPLGDHHHSLALEGKVRVDNSDS